MVGRTIPTVAALGILLLAACHERSTTARGGLHAAVDTVDGVPRTTYSGSGGPMLDWAWDTVAVIGDVMGSDEHYMLGQVPEHGVAGDADGDVFVLDAAAHHVLAYDSSGSYVATHGRQGNGPGELGAPTALTVGPGDTVWVQGVSTHRLTGFPIAGGDARTLVLSTSAFLRSPIAAVSGAFLTEAYPLPNLDGGGDASKDAAGVVPLLSIPADGSRFDTLWSRPAPKQDLVPIRTASGAHVLIIMTPTFEPTLHWDTFADGSIAIASDDTYTIHLLGPDGSERMRVARDLPPRPVSDADRDAVRNQIREGYERRSKESGQEMDASTRATMEQRIKAMTFAATIPRITGIRVDKSDRIWVGVSLQQPDSTERVDVFERDGSLLGSIGGMQLPATFFAADRALALRRDTDTDVQQVVVLRLREGGR